VGPLRAALLAHFGELVHDVVIAGHDRDDVRVLVFPHLPTCRRLAAAAPDAPVEAILAHHAVLERFATALDAFAAENAASSMCVERAILLTEPPSIDGGELTDKNSLNQKAVLRRRHALVEQLYGAPGSALAIDLSQRTAGA
jgi:feruloyl-CoA synthase